MTSKQEFPEEFDEAEVQRIIAAYDERAATNSLVSERRYVKHGDYAQVEVPKRLLPTVRRLIAEYERTKGTSA
jgi:hypothetical protein